MKKGKSKYFLFIIVFLPLIFYSCNSPTSVDPINYEITTPPVIPGIVKTGVSSPEPLGVIGNPIGRSSLSDNSTVKNTPAGPGSFTMSVPYPNPTEGATVIRFTLPVSVKVSIWVVKGIAPGESIRGHKVYFNGDFKANFTPFSMKLYEKNAVAGYYAFTWNCKDQNGNVLPDGLYRIYIDINGKLMFQDLMIYHLTFEQEPAGLIPSY